MQILQGIGHAKLGSGVEMKRRVSQKREVNQQHSPVQFLKSNRGIHRDGSGARSAFGVGDHENPSAA